MLQIEKKDVDFLVTANMVDEVKTILSRDFPRVDAIVREAVERGVERVYYVACGSPLCACQTAEQVFDRYARIPCKSYSAQDFLDSTPMGLDGKCLVIGVSQSGTTEEVTESIKLARSKGALTVALTRDEGNPLANSAERLIAYGAECIWEIHLLLSFRFAISMINALCPHPDVEKIAADLEKLPDILARLVESAEESSRELGLEAAQWPLIYTVGAGPLLPMAYKEGVITMLEFTWTHGCCLNAAEFRHGPLEVVDKDVPYVILKGTDGTRPTVERVEKFVKQYSDKVVVFDFAEIAGDLHPMLSPFVLFVPLEYFYYYLSLGKDHNPDDRRYYGGLVQY